MQEVARRLSLISHFFFQSALLRIGGFADESHIRFTYLADAKILFARKHTSVSVCVAKKILLILQILRKHFVISCKHILISYVMASNAHC